MKAAACSIHWTGRGFLAADSTTHHEIPGTENETLDACIRAAHREGYVVAAVNMTLGNVIRREREERKA